MRNRAQSVVLCGCLIAALGLSAAQAQVPAQGPAELQLEVVINDKPTGVIIASTEDAEGYIRVARSELESAGVLAPQKSGDDIVLQHSGLAFSYDKPAQQLRFQLLDGQRKPKIYDMRGEPPPPTIAAASWGGLINYAMFASTYGSNFQNWNLQPGGASLSYDARLFSPYGILTQTGIIGNSLQYDGFAYGNMSGLRLDTTFSYDDQVNRISYRAGDVITAGLEWTRSIRIGGLQAQRNFATRPDLVTAALPSVSGTAAVPSTVDVLINGAKAYSQQVVEGPFTLSNIPIASAHGAQVVIRDASGRETRSDISLYADPRLLAPGVFDISGETGAVRKFYAYRSDEYDSHVVASASLRYGLWDWLTLQGHAEYGSGLVNAGAGAVTRVGSFGTLTAAASWSRFGADVGGQIYGAVTIPLPYAFQFQASTQRTISAYNDLASATALTWRQEAADIGARKNYAGVPPALLTGSIYTPLTTNSVSLGGPVPVLEGSFNLIYAQSWQDPRDCALCGSNGASRVISASYSRPLPFDATMTLVAFAQTSDTRNRGFFAGITMPLGEGIRSSASVQPMTAPNKTNSRLAATAQVYKDLTPEIGSYGWAATAGTSAASIAGASGAYRSSVGTVKLSASSYEGQQAATAEFQGAIAFTGGSFTIGPHVDDAFAIVRADAPGVAIMAANQKVGETNMLGTLLIPNLNSYSPNRIAIDPLTLPIEADFDATDQTVVPQRRSGVLVDFGVRAGAAILNLKLTDRSGAPLEVGNAGYAEDTGEKFVVGYDGAVHLKSFGAVGRLAVNLGERDCIATVTRQTMAEEPTGRTVICE